MARTAVTPTTLPVNGSAAAPAATTTGSGAGNGITVTTPASEQLLLKVVGTNAGNVSVKAGAGTASTAAGQGDLVVAVGSSAEVMIGPFESARFQQADGTIAVDFSAVMAVQAYRVNRH